MSDPQEVPSIDEMVEQLAEIEHERWADWQKWCHKILRENCPSPELEAVLERWDRQINTPYLDLSEAEKQSDRDQVARYLPILQAREASIRQNEEVKRFNESFLRCPVKGCYKKDPVRFIDYDVLGDHIQFSHIDRDVLSELKGILNCWEHPSIAPYFLTDRIKSLEKEE